MNIDYESLSAEELRQIINEAQKALKTVDARRKAEAKRAAEKAAKEYGFSLDEIVVSKGKGSKGMAKFVNPEDPTQTWTGRGRKPNWVIKALDDGKALEDLAI